MQRESVPLPPALFKDQLCFFFFFFLDYCNGPLLCCLPIHTGCNSQQIHVHKGAGGGGGAGRKKAESWLRLLPRRQRGWRGGPGKLACCLLSSPHPGISGLRPWPRKAYQKRLLQLQCFWPCCYFIESAEPGISSGLLWSQQAFLGKNMTMICTEGMDQITCTWILAVPLTCSVTLDQLLLCDFGSVTEALSVSASSTVKWNDDSIRFIGWLWKTRWVSICQVLGMCLSYGQCSRSAYLKYIFIKSK